MPNPSNIGGLPSLTVAPPPTWTPNGGGSYQSQYEGPPTPQSTGMLSNTPPRTRPNLAAFVHHKEQEYFALQTMFSDNQELAKQVDRQTKKAKDAVNSLATFRGQADQAIKEEKQRRCQAEDANAQLSDRVTVLEQEKLDLGQNIEELSSNVMHLQGQNHALEEEAMSLRRNATQLENEATLSKGKVTSLEGQIASLREDITRKEADWSEKEKKFAADNATVQNDLTAQRRLRFEIEEERDRSRSGETKLRSDLQESKKEKAACVEQLEIAQRETRELDEKRRQTQDKADEAEKQHENAKTSAEASKKKIEHQEEQIMSLQKARDELKSVTTNQAATIEQQRTEISSLQASKKSLESSQASLSTKTDRLRKEKEDLYERLDKATIGNATMSKNLTQSQKRVEVLEGEKKGLHQRCHTTGQERDAATAAAEELKVQVKKHEVHANQLRSDLSEQTQELQRYQKLANAIEEFTAKQESPSEVPKKETPQATEETSDAGMIKLKQRETKEQPAISPTAPPECPANQPDVSSVTPRDYHSATSDTTIAKHTNDESSNFVAPEANMQPSDASKESPTKAEGIHFPLPKQTPAKRKAPKVKSPLASASSDPAQDDVQSSKSALGSTSTAKSTAGTKRRAAEEQQDPRPVKQPQTGPRKGSREILGGLSGEKSNRSSHARRPRSPKSNPYGRKW